MAKKIVVIEVSSACLALWVQQGSRWILLETSEQPDGDWTEQWQRSLSSLVPRVSQWVSTHALAGCQACVVYGRPGTPVMISSVIKGAPGAAATRLALSEASPFSFAEARCSVVSLGSDRSNATACQEHFLAFAELHTVLESIESFTSACGLVPAGAVPDSAVLLDSAFSLSSASDAARPLITLNIGHLQSAVVAREAGRMRFARCLPIGLEQIASTVKREILARGGTAAASLGPIEVLKQVGVPRRGASGFGVPLDAILPATQSVLQRLVVEIKQSIRFGFTEQTRSHVVLLASGRGLEVTDLIPTIAGQCGCETSPAVESSTPAVQNSPASRTLLLHALRSIAATGKSTVTDLRRAVLLGGALAMLCVAGDAAVTRMRVTGLEREVEQLSASASDSGSTKAVADKTLINEAALAAVTSRINAWYGQSTRPDALMLELAAAAGTDAVISEFDLRAGKDIPVARLRGVAFGDPRRVVQRIVDTLAASPLVAEAKLESIRRGGRDAGGREGDQFDIVLRLSPVPASAVVLTSLESGQ